MALSVFSPHQLADWQKRLVLGPGDVLDVSLSDVADSARTGIIVGPDGRISYLQARDVTAAGLTIDELRAELERVLGKYHRFPRAVITPVTYASKKYYLLGSIMEKGVYSLDRPVTIIEAIARAKGFEVSVAQRNSLLVADLSRSFLMRREPDGTFNRLDVDFDALFLRGDLTQNKALAPDDYLYFPPLDLQEVYVLGEVRAAGPVSFVPDISVLRVIASRGGFNEGAYRSKVLVVRGSLQQPQTFVVNVSDILNGKAADFALKPRDLVYVSRRPWYKAEQLLKLAILDFGRAIVVTWTGRSISPTLSF